MSGRAEALLVGLPEPGATIAGKYVIERVLAVGGMGAVMLAHDEALDRRVAIKFMLPKAMENADVRARFLREARAAVAIRSEHVVDVYEVGVTPPDMPFMVMEYLPGRDLHRLLESRAGLLSVAEAVDFVLQACEALAEAHSLGIVHRDVKPSNFFVTHRPDGSHLLKVLDFGISKTTGSMRFEEQAKSLTQSSVALGSPLYMSPEQVRNSKVVDARTDIWSIGVVLYELLAKRLPFDGETVPSLAAAIASDAPKPLRDSRPDIPPALESAIMKCLEKDPGRRFQSVSQLARALMPFAPSERRSTSFERIESGTNPLAFQSTTEHPSPLSEKERKNVARSGQVTIDAGTTTAGLGTTRRFVDRRRRSLGLLFGGVVVGATVITFAVTQRHTVQVTPAATTAPTEPSTVTPDEPVHRVTDIETLPPVTSVLRTPPPAPAADTNPTTSSTAKANPAKIPQAVPKKPPVAKPAATPPAKTPAKQPQQPDSSSLPAELRGSR